MKFDVYGIGMLLIVVLIVGLFFLYLILPQIEKVVDVPLTEDRDKTPPDQVQEDIGVMKDHAWNIFFRRFCVGALTGG